MPSRKMLKSVIHGFLGTYVSRYSDFDGYLLFGFIVDSLSLLEIDLTESEPALAVRTPHGELSRLARQKFKEQLSKVGLPISVVRNATLRICKGEPRWSYFGRGFDVSFSIRVETDLGRVYEDGVREYIAPQTAPDAEPPGTGLDRPTR
jgi:hypothetical protein